MSRADARSAAGISIVATPAEIGVGGSANGPSGGDLDSTLTDALVSSKPTP